MNYTAVTKPLSFSAYPDGTIEEVKLRHCNTSRGDTKIIGTYRLVKNVKLRVLSKIAGEMFCADRSHLPS